MVVPDLFGELADLFVEGVDGGVGGSVDEVVGAGVEEWAVFWFDGFGGVGDGVEVFAADGAVVECVGDVLDGVGDVGSVAFLAGGFAGNVAGAEEGFFGVGGALVGEGVVVLGGFDGE